MILPNHIPLLRKCIFHTAMTQKRTGFAYSYPILHHISFLFSHEKLHDSNNYYI